MECLNIRLPVYLAICKEMSVRVCVWKTRVNHKDIAWHGIVRHIDTKKTLQGKKMKIKKYTFDKY